MSEIINNTSERLQELLAFTKAMIEGESGHPLVMQYKFVTDKVTPTETMEVLDILIREGIPVKKVKAWVPKILNVFYNSLKEFQWEVPSKDHFLHYLMEENRAVENVLEDIRTISKTAFSEKRKEDFELLRQRIADLIPYELHYIKKENILFPYIEKAFEGHRCLSVMWSFHDDYRQSIKNWTIFYKHLFKTYLRLAVNWENYFLLSNPLFSGKNRSFFQLLCVPSHKNNGTLCWLKVKRLVGATSHHPK